jgi:hypothetical protein
MKETYNATEIAIALNVNLRKILTLLKQNKIKHTHVNHTHASARIPREEYIRLVKASS